VLDGFAVRDVDVVGRPATELLGRGDRLRPWEPDRATPFRSHVRWLRPEPWRVALLDERLCAAISRWPDLSAALVGRAVARSREHAIALAAGQIPCMRLWVLVILWHIAGQWDALTALRRAGLVDRAADGRLILIGNPPSALAQLRAVGARA
jgi:CRP/FNR family transcriptional regulator, cyclic AMP receptor protein